MLQTRVRQAADYWTGKLSYAAKRRLMTHPAYARLMLTQGAGAAFAVRSRERVRRLGDVEFQVFSQYGDDGIIEWIVHHNDPMPESFVEFGVENYIESQTRFLLMFRNWRGLVMDGDAHSISVIQDDSLYDQHDITAYQAFVTRENINTLLSTSGFTGEVGLLSIDIDGNDYWVWQAIECMDPHIVVVEYNAVLGDRLALTIPYDPHFVRTRAHYSNLYFGASIRALTKLAGERGYELLGTNSAGNNAFYMRRDRFARFGDRIADRSPRPSRFRESRDAAGRLTFARGRHRATEIGQCEVVDVESGRTGPLASFGDLYSAAWLRSMEGDGAVDVGS